MEISTENRIDVLLEVIRKNEHLLESSNVGVKKKKYDYSSRLVIADNVEFLEAIRKEMGGELIINKSIGNFLYFD